MSVQSQIDRINQNVSNTYAVLAGAGADMPTEQNSDNLSATAASAFGNLKFDPTVYGLPVLYLTGDTTGMTKDNAVSLSYVFGENSGSCTLKWQGSSSLAYAKKNYTIKLGTAVEIVEGWGAQTKYCLKANFIDHSHARNIVCAKLWGQMVKSRATVPAELADLPNAGAVDGFPIVIVLNDEFHGLYTWNIPKDGWMFGMGSGTQEAFVCADIYGDAVGFHALADLQNDFELEYSTDGASDWVLVSLNRLIQAVMDSTGTDLDTKLAKYIDWDSAIDYYIYTVLIEGADNTKKNYILATYDGTKWFYSAYDMDSTFGLQWAGLEFLPADNRPTFATRISDGLMALIWNHKRKQLYDRAKEIMESVFSENNVYSAFTNFASALPTPVLIEDVKKWPTIPSSAANNTAQILNYYRMRFALALKWLEDAMDGYGEDTESTVTNLVPTSIDTDGTVFNGTGYQDGMRLSSSGAIKAQDNSTTTGFIACTNSDIIRMTGAVFADYANSGTNGTDPGNGIGALYSYLGIYDSSKNLLYCIQGNTAALSAKGITVTGRSYPITFNTDVATFDFSGHTGDMAFIRFTAIGSGANMIVTKNEEIA